MNIVLNDSIWDTIRGLITDASYSSDWAKRICRTPLSAIREQTMLRFEERVIDSSYIDFLQQQIDVEVRGAEWTALLKQRRSALRHFIGKPIWFLSIIENSHVLSVWLNFKSEYIDLILVEVH